ncbi:MAG: WecB/TagA/CpsF family glycosyltransferase [Thermovirgaceae bacterium]|nr:WecB/TagA/CpsF family glycosyltransferase [Thermovirgaceae bacterium]
MPVDVHEVQGIVLLALSLFVSFFVIQKISKKALERDQYQFLKDVSLLAAWALCGVWTSDSSVRLVISLGMLSAIIGVGQRVLPRLPWAAGFFAVGALLSASGLGISFIGFPDGEFLFLSRYSSLIVTAVWVGIFPLLLQEMDQIPGLAGFLSAITWVIMLIVTGMSRQHISGAFYMTFMGVVILAVFWSRHGHSYRRLGEPVAALWGTLLAGTSILGVSKGVTFSTLMLIPLGLFAIPIAEASYNIVNRAFSSRPQDTLFLYRKLVSKGFDHTPAVRTVGALCAVLGAAVASFQLRDERMTAAALLFSAIALGGALVVMSMRSRTGAQISGRSSIWGVPVDNISVDYALGRIRSWIHQDMGGRYIVTLDALSALKAREEPEFRNLVRGADLVLPDGKGLISALGFLGSPVVQRIPGVDFVERMCRQAASEGWPVFFLGGAPGIAQRTAARLEKMYPALIVGGTVHGFIDELDMSDVLGAIRRSGSRFVFVGMGVPKQESWMSIYGKTLDGTVSIGVGGSFNVISGDLKRAPAFLQSMGLEWLFRLAQEPWRWCRVCRLPLFVLHVILTRMGFSSLKGE